MSSVVYKRVVLKISGEALAGNKGFGIDFDTVNRIADEIKEVKEMGVQIGLVVGGEIYGVEEKVLGWTELLQTTWECLLL